MLLLRSFILNIWGVILLPHEYADEEFHTFWNLGSFVGGIWNSTFMENGKILITALMNKVYMLQL